MKILHVVSPSQNVLPAAFPVQAQQPRVGGACQLASGCRDLEEPEVIVYDQARVTPLSSLSFPAVN